MTCSGFNMHQLNNSIKQLFRRNRFGPAEFRKRACRPGNDCEGRRSPKMNCGQLKSRVRRLILELEQLATNSAKGALKKPFVEDQANALVRDITAEIPKITDAMNRNKISRVEAALIHSSGRQGAYRCEKGEVRRRWKLVKFSQARGPKNRA